jgi:hypothetical protein
MTETRITQIAWGNMAVDVGGQTHRFKDCKVWPGGAREWNWKETGTGHSPGIQPVDLEEILEQDPEAVVLGRGVLGRLEVCTETEALLRERGIACHMAKTPEAVVLFNDLAGKGVRVGGLFHSTC